jgi:hypothetical protein
MCVEDGIGVATISYLPTVKRLPSTVGMLTQLLLEREGAREG